MGRRDIIEATMFDGVDAHTRIRLVCACAEAVVAATTDMPRGHTERIHACLRATRNWIHEPTHGHGIDAAGAAVGLTNLPIYGQTPGWLTVTAALGANRYMIDTGVCQEATSQTVLRLGDTRWAQLLSNELAGGQPFETGAMWELVGAGMPLDAAVRTAVLLADPAWPTQERVDPTPGRPWSSTTAPAMCSGTSRCRQTCTLGEHPPTRTTSSDPAR